MKTITAIFVLVVFCSVGYAGDLTSFPTYTYTYDELYKTESSVISEKKPTDWYVLEGVFIFLMGIDRSQTMGCVHSGTCHETNPSIGKFPNDSTINNHFAVGAIAHAAIAWYLPDHFKVFKGTSFEFDIQPRIAWQAGWIGGELNQIDRNRRIGAAISLRF